MLLALFCAALATGGGHSQLHPAGADVYFELGSPKDAFVARERAPFNKLFADEEMKKLYGLLETFGVPVQSLGDAALPQALFGETSPFRALQHASFSASGVDQLGSASDVRLGLEGVLDFADPANATAALAALEGWKALEPDTNTELAKQFTIGEHACALHWFHAAADSPVPIASTVWFAQDGARLYLGSSENQPEHVAARAAGKEPGLPEEAKLFAGTEAMSPSSGLPLYRLWSDIDLQGLLHSPELSSFGDGAKVLLPWITPMLLPAAGAQGVWRVELRGERFVTESVYRRHPAFETKAFGNGNVDASAARFVPKEAVGAWVTNIDGPALEGEVRALLGALMAKGKEPRAAALAELPSLVDGLGTHAAFYLLPINSIQALVPRAFLAVELKDKARFEAALTAWSAKLAQIAPEAKLVDKPYRKLPCVSISIGKDAEEPASPSPLGGLTPDMSLSPTIVVFDDRVLFGIKKNFAQSEARRIVDGKQSELHEIANPETFQKDVFEASVMDWGGLFGKLLDIAKGLAPMAAGLMGENAPPIDASALPGSATLARYFKPTTSWSKRLADGRIYTRSESSFGPETPLEIALFASAAGPLARQRGNRTPAPTFTPGATPGATPGKAPAPAPVSDESAIATQAALLSVKTGIAVYKIENAKLPATLETLLAPTASYPDGFLAPQKSVPKDGWGHALVFKPDAEGKRFLLYSLGPDGKDDGGAGDDVKAP